MLPFEYNINALVCVSLAWWVASSIIASNLPLFNILISIYSELNISLHFSSVGRSGTWRADPESPSLPVRRNILKPAPRLRIVILNILPASFFLCGLWAGVFKQIPWKWYYTWCNLVVSWLSVLQTSMSVLIYPFHLSLYLIYRFCYPSKSIKDSTGLLKETKRKKKGTRTISKSAETIQNTSGWLRA